MKIIVFGATGSIGQLVVQQATEAGHQVTAFTRDSNKIKLQQKNLSIVQGDVFNIGDVEQAIAGHEVVICVLGAGRNGIVRDQGTKNIVAAMKSTAVKRLICQSSLGVGDSRCHLNFFWKYLMFGLLLRPAYHDHELQEQHVRNSDLDWTIVRPASFINGKRTGTYRQGFGQNEKNLQLKISREDVADFIVKQISCEDYLHKSPGISY